MIIYSMTATFGKLEHETISLQPGLNVIYAPNEWGKSTWCAFLLAMLYGLDTRAKTTKSALADKEHFAPWSGSPMSGRIDLCWNGRDITIERSTKGRVPLGQFLAFETASGIPIPELTAANCAQMLLGVEQSVYRRAGFIRLTDLPVTQDDALRRRLNALVTTGDESGDAELLEKGLRDIKNKCRYHKSGLIPQTQEQLRQLENSAEEIRQLTQLLDALHEQIGQAQAREQALSNHLAHLNYQEAQQTNQQIHQAEKDWDDAKRQLDAQAALCGTLPKAEEAQAQLRQLSHAQQQKLLLTQELRRLSEPMQSPDVPMPFRGVPPENAPAVAEADSLAFEKAKPKDWLFGILFALFSAVAGFTPVRFPAIYSIFPAVAALAFLIAGVISHKRHARTRNHLAQKYGKLPPTQWIGEAVHFRELSRQFRQQESERQAQLRKVQQDLRKLSEDAEGNAETALNALNQWQTLDNRKQAEAMAARQYAALKAMAKPVSQPAASDSLTLSRPETMQLLAQTQADLTAFQKRSGQYQGRLEGLGSAESCHQKILTLQNRLDRLEKTYAAADLALHTLAQSTAQLQSRFAPKITSRAQEILRELTDGRHNRLSLADDLTLRSGAVGEDTLRETLWRSDGTADQLYLALRLAVAEELTPQAPLILDDALVRFDEYRMKAAVCLLKKMSQNRQVILFSCQEREKEAFSYMQTAK